MTRPVTTLSLAVASGALVGAVSHMLLDTPVELSFWGGALAATGLALMDRLKARRLQAWLRSGQDDGAPRMGAEWGEIAYLVEKTLLARSAAFQKEASKLTDFLSAIDASPNGVLLLDADHHLLWCNRVAAEHYGLNPRKDRGQRITNLVRSPVFVRALAHNEVETVAFPAPGGRARLSVMFRRYGEGQWLVLSQDVTEQERTEAIRRDFVANVSHEIRTPLTVLSGFVESLATLPLSDEERRRAIVLMQQQTDRMQSLVADLLTLAQLEGSPQPTADQRVPVQALLERVAADARGLSQGRHVIEIKGLPHSDAIFGSEKELLSALGNLASNAVRYTPEGGHIWLDWTVLRDGRAALTVRDTGPGIAKEHWPRLAERFYRVDSGRSRDTGGTGLGLAIVKHTIQRHGGELRIDSQLGEGSSFSLVFPARRVQRDLTPEAAALSA